MRWLFGLGAVVLAACGSVVGDGADGGAGGGDAGPVDETLVRYLEVVPLDVWGRDVETGAVTFDRPAMSVPQPGLGPAVVLVPLGDEAFETRLRVEGRGLRTTTLTLSYDARSGPEAVSHDLPSAGARAILGADRREVLGRAAEVVTLYVGLDHPWFAPNAAAPTFNRVTLLHDGEEAWSAVQADLLEAQRRVQWTTWWWTSTFELVRPERHPFMIEAEREPNTVMGIAERQANVEWRLLLNRFWGNNLDWTQYLNSDAALLAAAEATGDGFEVMLDANTTEVPVGGQWRGEPTPASFAERVAANPRYASRFLIGEDLGTGRQRLEIDAASWHQKAVVIDGEVAFVGGMNTTGTDWDTSEHLVFEPRRMDFDATIAERQDVLFRNSLPDHPPVKDYFLRIEGPAARDVEEVLWRRWELAMDGGALYADRSTRYSLESAAPEPAEGVPTQIVVTHPAPLSEMTILETHRKALANAEEYILIEDQYFRAPMLNQVIAARMVERPELRLVVITIDVGEWDGGKKFTYLSDDFFRSLFPDRYQLFELRAFDVFVDDGLLWDTVDLHATPMYTHSKLRLVDDVYLSVGSCNFNNRGYLYEGEMNATVVDPRLATATRQRIFESIVGPVWADRLTGEIAADFEVLREAAADNRAVLDWWEQNAGDLSADEARAALETTRPSGFLYPLRISGDYRIEVGPDVF